ncbi:MAG: hypothetical protein KKH74_03525 [Gammaproteobacteria bacterium]|nr:hypothetical protein [Gammaproteobacteria bacterium]MBU1733064.1 hypothetical protein [Gammaproteobacteria bacterium]MBU1892112.1 hypothetical protein [Gammaproteobacteria bacterium]
MEITCYRDPESARESLFLSAATYNLAHALLSRSTSGCLFVPIRPMQYLAILDAEEVVFLDGERKCWIDVAWQNFQPQRRVSLDEPVAYEAVYYRLSSSGLMARLLAEFPRALTDLAAKGRFEGSARVLKFPAPGRP